MWSRIHFDYFSFYCYVIFYILLLHSRVKAASLVKNDPVLQTMKLLLSFCKQGWHEAVLMGIKALAAMIYENKSIHHQVERGSIHALWFNSSTRPVYFRLFNHCRAQTRRGWDHVAVGNAHPHNATKNLYTKLRYVWVVISDSVSLSSFLSLTAKLPTPVLSSCGNCLEAKFWTFAKTAMLDVTEILWADCLFTKCFRLVYILWSPWFQVCPTWSLVYISVRTVVRFSRCCYSASGTTSAASTSPNVSPHSPPRWKACRGIAVVNLNILSN